MPDIAYTVSGEGPAVVLIHGFCESKEMWQHFQELLSTHFTVYSPDLPGFGESPLASAEISIEDVAEKIGVWMQEKEILDPIVIGHSLGGYVSLGLARSMGSQLGGLCLFHSTALPDDEEKKGVRNRTIKFLEKHGVVAFVDSFLPQLFPESSRDEQAPIINSLLSIARELPLETLTAYTKAMRDRPDSSGVLKNIKAHTALIAGELDTAVPLEISAKHKAWVNEYFELKETGHMGMFEKPEESLEFISRFIRQAIS